MSLKLPEPQPVKVQLPRGLPRSGPTEGYVVTLPDCTPAIRYDGNPWETVTIGEAANSSGPYNVLDTITLSPVDSDPTNPLPRSFTITNATLPSGWYQVTFIDAGGGIQALTPVPYPPPEDQATTPYCSVLDVQARTANRPVTASSLPSIAQVQQFVIDAAAEINAILVNKGYLIPIVSASNPDAFALLHSANVTGGWAMMELASPQSINKDAAAKAWEAAKMMLSDQKFVLNAPMDQQRGEPRGPWVTTQPTGETYDPMFGHQFNRRDGNPANPYFSRQARY